MISIRRLLIALCLIFLSSLSLPVIAAGNPLPLWEARSPQGATVYLFGSVHVCNASCFPLPQAALERLDSSHKLVVEIDPRRPEAQQKLMAAAMLPEGQKLSVQMGSPQWQSLTEVAGKMGLPAAALDSMRPWMVDMMLSLSAAQQMGYNVSQGIDLNLMQRAEKKGLGLEELETVDAQVAAVSAGSEKEQIVALNRSVAQLRSGRMEGYLGEMIQAWRTGNADELNRLVHETMSAEDNLTKILIDQRNLKMAASIEQKMTDGQPRFVVVGMAHLVGPEGVPALLRKQGYAVRQIDQDN